MASVRDAFVAGIDDAARFAAGVAVAAVIIALAFLPSRAHEARPAALPSPGSAS